MREFIKITKKDIPDLIGKAMQVVAIEKAGIFRHSWLGLFLVVKEDGLVFMIDVNGESLFRDSRFRKFSELIEEAGDSYDFLYFNGGR